jgi:hypothetical protein
MEVLKLNKDDKELFVEATGIAYTLATENGWIREYMILDDDIILNPIEEIKQ